jgi:hypothetical protein
MISASMIYTSYGESYQSWTSGNTPIKVDSTDNLMSRSSPHGRFDITRAPNPHVGFGSADPLLCLSAHLARRPMT